MSKFLGSNLGGVKGDTRESVNDLLTKIDELNSNKEYLSELFNRLDAQKAATFGAGITAVRSLINDANSKIRELTLQMEEPVNVVRRTSFGSVWVGTPEDWKVIAKYTNPLLDYFEAEAKGVPILEQAVALVKPLFQVGIARRDMLSTLFRMGAYAKDLFAPDSNSLYLVTPAMQGTLGSLPALFYKVRDATDKKTKDLNINNLTTFQILLEDAKVPMARGGSAFDGKYLPLQSLLHIIFLNTFPNKRTALFGGGSEIPSLQAKIEDAAKIEGKDPKIKEAEIDEVVEQVNEEINALNSQLKALYEQTPQYKARRAAKARK
jgi:hypothetical protein